RRHRPEARGRRVEPGRLRREGTGVGVGPAHDEREVSQSGIAELVLLQERIEGTAVAVMTELHPGHVVWDGVFTLRHPHDLRRGNEEEGRLLVDEATDQPGTGE